MVLADEYIDSLFENSNFGEPVNNSNKEKRKLIIKSLRNQLEGYWSGHTIYHILIDGGFLHDCKTDEKKRLTKLGEAFLQEAK